MDLKYPKSINKSIQHLLDWGWEVFRLNKQRSR